MSTYEPTEYDQHVRYADNETDRARSNIGEDGPASGIIFATLAVVEATLAAAEQARISNLIALARHERAEIDRGIRYGNQPTREQLGRLINIADLACEGLGLPSATTATDEANDGPPPGSPPEPAVAPLLLAGDLSDSQRIAVELRAIGQVHTFDNDAERDYRELFLTEVIDDPTESHLHERARAELAEYRRVAGPIEPGDGVYECDLCGARFDGDHYGDVEQHEVDNEGHSSTLRHRMAGE